MNIELDEKVLQKITDTLHSNPKVSKIILFGSRVKGTAKQGSDIDLAIVGDHIDFREICNLSTKLDDLDLPYTIDLIDYQSITNDALKNHIDRVGFVV